MMTREQVVAEARTWLGTPYHRRSAIKGVGCDCATLLYAIYRNCGVIQEDEDIGAYTDDWWSHTSEENYMLRVVRHAEKIAERVGYTSDKVEPGNLLLMKAANSRVYNHGAIVTAWPRIVHCIQPRVEEVSIGTDPMWSYKQIIIFDPWKKRNDR